MHKKLYISMLLAGLCFLHMTAPGEALAYIDPGAGSYAFQVLLALLLGAAVSIRAFWSSIKDFFKRRSDSQEKDGD